MRPLKLSVLLLSTILAAASAAASSRDGADEARRDNWLSVVRETPYWDSKGVAANLKVMRRWVLLDDSYCSKPARHVLFDRRGRFLGYIDDGATPTETNAKLNSTRERMAREGRVKYWSPGTDTGFGYPFALACHQPHANMKTAIARMTGAEEEYRLWGTWDGMRIGEPDSQVPLIQVLHEVYAHRSEQGRFSFPQTVMASVLGQILIESGGVKHALSTQAARGIMQLRPAVLDDCNIPDEYRLHRMAQIDCALRLNEQNHRNLSEPFTRLFAHLPEKKRAKLYGMLLVQAYQIGVGRTIELLQDPELGAAAQYFAAHHQMFTAEDIAVGMIYHNLGRKDLGLLSLYYVVDAQIAAGALCAKPSMKNDPWCRGA